MAIDWSVTSTPSVAMTRTSGDAVRSGRMMSRCVSAPIDADHADGAEREVEDAGAAVDDHQALRRERVQGADAEPEEGEADELLHGREPRERGGPGSGHAPGAGAASGLA